MSIECPGRFRCHGPASWCPECGDVDLICDDPHCDVHLRGAEREARCHVAKMDFDRAWVAMREAEQSLIAASTALGRWREGHPVMVSRKPKASK